MRSWLIWWAYLENLTLAIDFRDIFSVLNNDARWMPNVGEMLFDPSAPID